MKSFAAALVSALLLAGPAGATSPYAELDSRDIKALPHTEVEDLLAGRGMGMALPAELNAYPGPVHVLDLAEALALTPAQRAETERLFAEMKGEAVPLGEQLVAGEAELDRLFADGAADEERLRALVERLAELRGGLRFTHLRYHLAMRALLTAEQVAAYQVERGYRSGKGGHAGQMHGGHGHGD